ncbi:hypothetical protein Tco_1107001 [Tanacetum coccineum]
MELVTRKKAVQGVHNIVDWISSKVETDMVEVLDLRLSSYSNNVMKTPATSILESKRKTSKVTSKPPNSSPTLFSRLSPSNPPNSSPTSKPFTHLHCHSPLPVAVITTFSRLTRYKFQVYENSSALGGKKLISSQGRPFDSLFIHGAGFENIAVVHGTPQNTETRNECRGVAGSRGLCQPPVAQPVVHEAVQKKMADETGI